MNRPKRHNIQLILQCKAPYNSDIGNWRVTCIFSLNIDSLKWIIAAVSQTHNF